jgi:hypothetical protein
MHVHTVGGGEEYTLHVHTASDWKGYSLPRQYCMRAVDGFNLHVHTTCDGTGYTSTSTLLAVERNKPRTSILLIAVVRKGTQHVHTSGGGKGHAHCTACAMCMVILLVAQRDTPCMSNAGGGGRETPAHSYCMWWKGTQPARSCCLWKKWTHLAHRWARIHPAQCTSTLVVERGYTLKVPTRLLLVLNCQ